MGIVIAYLEYIYIYIYKNKNEKTDQENSLGDDNLRGLPKISCQNDPVPFQIGPKN
jgi:hypothetical protein